LIINQGKIVLDKAMKELQNNSDKIDHIEIALRNPPALEELLNIEGVASAESNIKDMLRINFIPDIDATDAIVEKAVAENWGLYKLNPSDTSLETIFMQLTYGDNEQTQETGTTDNE
jgi:ABC-2 type transport system ATP-binding protein